MAQVRKKQPSKAKASMLGKGLANFAGKLLGSRQQQIESAVSPVGKHKGRKQ